ncbi:MAG: lamin tail domain-containing protein [Spirochaetales bacterium]|nr:lamin tail domain-containing protein [Spirochaetales bacterium]
MILIFFLMISFLVSCSETLTTELLPDLAPPELAEITLTGSRSLTFRFNEAVSFDESSFFSEPALDLESWSTDQNTLTINFSEEQTAGKMYKCRSDVLDEKGNRLSFLVRFYGWNDNLPDLLINEFNPEGSGNNPDTVELYVRKEGNTAGTALFLGTSRYFSSYYVLPELDVSPGDYIIIHLRPEDIPEEINESTGKGVSGGKLASDLAWDLWADEDMPLSGSNGLICLYTNPFGEIIDAVPYSDRITADSEEYRGWTAATFDMIEELSFMEIWKTAGEFIRPEDAVSSNGTTGTRSLCRDSLSTDSDSPGDWHLVPTGEKSFGEVNSDNIYAP